MKFNGVQSVTGRCINGGQPYQRSRLMKDNINGGQFKVNRMDRC